MRHRQTLTSLLPALCLLLGALPAAADTLEMPAQENGAMPSPPEERELITMQIPAKGMSKAQVARDFGEPLEKIPAVGEPPIGRWIYQEYTVYFEGQYVIHSVLNQ